MAERHFQRPGNPGPEAERGEEFRRQAEVVLDEKGADDAGQARDARSYVDHQRRQVGQAHLAPELEYIAIDPAIG